MKIFEIINLYKLISSAKTSKMAAADAVIIYRNARKMKKALEEFEDVRKDLMERYDGNREEIEAALVAAVKEEVELELIKLSEDAFLKFIESNEMKVGQVVLLEEKLVG